MSGFGSTGLGKIMPRILASNWCPKDTHWIVCDQWDSADTTGGIYYNTAAPTTYTTSNVWYQWNHLHWNQPDAQTITNIQVPALSRDQIMLQLDREHTESMWQQWNIIVQRSQAELAAQRQREADRQKAADIAKQTAERLLMAHLTPQQRDQYKEHRYFDVHTARGRTVRRYRIHYGWAGNIQVFEGERHVSNLCIHPTTQVPYADNLLAQKLMLEADEQKFLATANHHPARAVAIAA